MILKNSLLLTFVHKYFVILWLETIIRWTTDFFYSCIVEPLESYITVEWFVCIFAAIAAQSILMQRSAYSRIKSTFLYSTKRIKTSVLYLSILLE